MDIVKSQQYIQAHLSLLQKITHARVSLYVKQDVTIDGNIEKLKLIKEGINKTLLRCCEEQTEGNYEKLEASICEIDEHIKILKHIKSRESVINIFEDNWIDGAEARDKSSMSKKAMWWTLMLSSQIKVKDKNYLVIDKSIQKECCPSGNI